MSAAGLHLRVAISLVEKTEREERAAVLCLFTPAFRWLQVRD